MKRALILYPHQLYAAEHLPEVHTVFMVEEPYFFGADPAGPLNMHKQRLILHRASMRRYAEEVLFPMGVNVEYIDLDVLYMTGDILDRAKHFEQLVLFDPIDDMLARRLLEARREHPKAPAMEFLPSPNFYLSDHEVREYFAAKHQQPFAEFYQWQRERFNILISEDYKPVGGQWMFDSEDAKPVSEGEQLPSFAVFGDHKHVAEAIKWVNGRFADNPGTTDFVWPTNHAEAAQWLQEFVDNRLDNFGPYQEAIDPKAAWLYHSALATSLNIGLLSPQQAVQAALRRHSERPVPLASLEAFVRHVLGWREFLRGQYVTRGARLRESNTFRHGRKLTHDWFDGTLGIPPYDDLIKKIHAHGYAHRSELLAVVGNLMLLSEIDPNEVYRWHREMLVDTYDWFAVPFVYGMSQFADGGGVVAKPYANPSNYVLQLSHYERDIWSDVWDGLFWRFIEKNRSTIAHNHHLRPIVQRLDRLDPDRRRIINYRAEDFLKRYTA